MKLSEHFKAIKHISGVLSVGYLNLKTQEEISFSNDNSERFKKLFHDLNHFLTEKILELNIISFRFKGNNQNIISFVQNDISIVLIIKNNTNFSILKSKIDNLLNDLLINL